MSDAQLPNGQPLFVVGCDRSGTTLLTAMLEAGLGLAAPLETHFIPYFDRFLWLWGDLSQPAQQKRLLAAVFAFQEILVTRNYPGKAATELEPVTLLAVRHEQAELQRHFSSFGQMVRAVFAAYARKCGRVGWVDNSSFYESLPLEIWQRHLPDLKVIHMVRDGRDVALSWRQSWWGPATLGEAAWLWSRHVTDKRAWGVRHPASYLEIRYETLLTRPEETLQAVARFLGLPEPEGAMRLTDSPTAQVLSTGGTHDLLRGPVRVDNREKWRRAMPEDEQRLFEFIAGETLCECGYPRSFPDPSFRERVGLTLRRTTALWKRFVTPIYYAKKAKWGMVPMLYLAGPLGHLVVRWATGGKR
ncbi:MAG: sulfotransferase [Magnetococcales bacterium]|nr:sulfotransferase [Magnetococcales bacterium]NGZ04825.1 sulfotransferase [Magnetococcales bacterium]